MNEQLERLFNVAAILLATLGVIIFALADDTLVRIVGITGALVLVISLFLPGKYWK